MHTFVDAFGPRFTCCSACGDGFLQKLRPGLGQIGLARKVKTSLHLGFKVPELLEKQFAQFIGFALKNFDPLRLSLIGHGKQPLERFELKEQTYLVDLALHRRQ